MEIRKEMRSLQQQSSHIQSCEAIDKQCIPEFKVLTLNVWGLPYLLGQGSKDKEERMRAIAGIVNKGEFDLYLLQELWLREDYKTIKNGLAPGYHITGYKELNSFWCTGWYNPINCAGLTVISKHPIVDSDFWKWGIGSEIEMITTKGFGRVRLANVGGLKFTMDVYIAHTQADEHHVDIRRRQVRMMMDKIKESTADIQILGGDINQHPGKGEDNPYQIILTHMRDSSEVVHNDTTQQGPEWMTYANDLNTYSGHGQYPPEVLDYIFYRGSISGVTITPNWFTLPYYQTVIDSENKSVSDHQSVTASFTIKQNSEKIMTNGMTSFGRPDSSVFFKLNIQIET